MHGYEHEVFGAIFLDSQHAILSFDLLFRGTIDSATIYPREVVKQALSYNAAAVIFVHNHPSGSAEPSEADKRITERLVNALTVLDIRVLDHFVVGGAEVVSFAERGLL
jgi:DNA repair protein RadC